MTFILYRSLARRTYRASIHPTTDPPIPQSIYLSSHPFIHPSIHPSINPFVHQPIHPSIHPSITPFIHQSIHPFISSLSIHPCIHLCIHPCIHPCIHLYIHPPIHSLIHPLIHPSNHPLVHQHIHPFIHPFTHPSITPSINPFIHTPIHPSIHYPSINACTAPGLEVIKLEYSLKLKIKRNNWLLADKCPFMHPVYSGYDCIGRQALSYVATSFSMCRSFGTYPLPKKRPCGKASGDLAASLLLLCRRPTARLPQCVFTMQMNLAAGLL